MHNCLRTSNSVGQFTSGQCLLRLDKYFVEKFLLFCYVNSYLAKLICKSIRLFQIYSQRVEMVADRYYPTIMLECDIYVFQGLRPYPCQATAFLHFLSREILYPKPFTSSCCNSSRKSHHTLHSLESDRNLSQGIFYLQRIIQPPQWGQYLAKKKKKRKEKLMQFSISICFIRRAFFVYRQKFTVNA